MIIVHMTGGLGNQMFQYSLFRNLYERNKEVYYETFFTKPHHNGFELDKVFNIVQSEAKDISLLSQLEKYGDKWKGCDPKVFEKKNVYLEGNWQNKGYFPEESILRNDFSFKVELDSKNMEILDNIKNSNSVSIHVRRTDYMNYQGYFFQADWWNYYGLATNYITKNVKDRPLNFFVFSDDIEWCKKNFMIPVTYVENKRNDSWKDMLLMSNCKHNITANSTFSWWAAWLNKNPGKIVITPKKWFLSGEIDSNLIVLEDWIKI